MKTSMLLSFFIIALHAATLSQNQPHSALKPVDINYMNRGYFYASSPPMEKTAGFGGWADSGNMYLRATINNNFKPNILSVQVRMDEPIPFAEEFKGVTLYLANTTADTIFFNAQDSRLNMKLQARDKNNNWKDIEYLPSSWCGNSYHMVYLPSQCFWKFAIPVYEGKMKTKLRAVLFYKSNMEGGDQQIFSNEFDGSINPGQFSKKEGYQSKGIMDPYND